MAEGLMNPHEIRRRFLSFFEERDHAVVASSPVVPKGDPTLLFANAGMNQFKDVFLGNEKRDYQRAASAQMCIRAGGKHNDLDEVGKDSRHLTFFEMLGNWSFGDYYKRESIKWGWEFVTKELGLDPERIYISVYKDDDESWDIWTQEVGIPDARMIRLGDIDKGDEENFWSMGPTGPCGPCTEMHYDVRPSDPYAYELGFDGERYVEFWNHVFMEFDRDEQGKLTPLPMRSVDTGMGLERAAILTDGLDSVFKTGLFKGIFEKTAQLLGIDADHEALMKRDDWTDFCVIADHIRSVTFAVSEGQPFKNDGRGYVLRRILRRAVRHGKRLGFTGPFLHEVAQAVIDDFGDVYPGLRAVAQQTRQVIRLEEEGFFRTIDQGISRFEDVAAKTIKKKRDTIDGKDVFTLYDTYGFPPDLTEIMAEEQGLKIDLDGYHAAMQEQKDRGKKGGRFYNEADVGAWVTLREGSADTFVGYTRLETDSEVMRYRRVGDYVEVLLDITPFYAESGGQVGDRGTLFKEQGNVSLQVLDTQKTPMGIVHLCQLQDGFVTEETMVGDWVARVDARVRQETMANHTATHLLHAALHELVSKDALQAGSLVRDDKLRFDFTYPKPLTRDEVTGLEDWVNRAIQAGMDVQTHVDIAREDAEAMGAMAIFGEKYGDRVRVVQAGPQSLEFCGGTHVSNTRDILLFKITQETAIAAGTRRIEAVTHRGAYETVRNEHALLERATTIAKADTTAGLPQRIERLQAAYQEASSYADDLFRMVAKTSVQVILSEGRDIEGVPVYAGRVDMARRRDQMLQVADLLRDRMGDGVAILGAVLDGKPALVCLVAKPLIKARGLKAGALVNHCAQVMGGRGGGRPNLAQAGGTDAAKLDDALQAIFEAVSQQLTR